MSTALLRFHLLDDEKTPGVAVLAAALELVPQPIAILEDGEVVYSNQSMAQLVNSQTPPFAPKADASWHQIDFTSEGRRFSLRTLRQYSAVGDSQHLAMIGRLVGGVAHDFNNLLTGILLYCDLMLSRIAKENPLARKIGEIRTAAEQGAGLIRQLMTVGREEKNAPQQVAFNHALQDLAPLLQHLIGENVQVSMEIGKSDGMVGISLAQAQQIILNLVLNARDASPSGGRIEVTSNSRQFAGIGPSDRILELRVKDYGSGMDAQTAARIFDPFFTTKEPGCGTGMGLTAVRKIVEDARGLVFVETAPGRGTEVTVRLPEMPASVPHPKSDEASCKESPIKKGASV